MLRWIKDYTRLAYVGLTLARHEVILPDIFRARIPAAAKWLGKLLRGRGRRKDLRQGQKLAAALESLGPAYIKLGQFLSTRADIFGFETANDLAHLKDKLPAFPVEEAEAALKTEFGEEGFATLFGPLNTPIAAASIAQVHKIETDGGLKAVKILRPNIEKLITSEIRAMRRGAGFAQSVSKEAGRLEAKAFVDTMAHSLLLELDLRMEAGAASEFFDVCYADKFFRIPEVDWERTSKSVLTTEWIEGAPLTAPHALENVNREQLAINVTQGFLASALNHGFFHADMHEGNMIVDNDGRIALVDFGIMGRIEATEARYLANILWGFITRDYGRIAEAHFEAGYVPQTQDEREFAQALRAVGEPVHGKRADEVSMGRLLLQLFDVTAQFGMHLRPELVMLQKTMAQIEGVSRNINPQHDLWAAAEPIVERFIRRQIGPEQAFKTALGAGEKLIEGLRQMPEVLSAIEAVLRQPRK